MKVAVIGAGGIGSLFGGRLATVGHEVWLVHRRSNYVDAVRQDGLLLESPTGAQRIPARATLDPREVGAADLILVLTKATDTRAAAESARALVGPQTTVLTLQNGLGNLEILADAVGHEHVLMGMTYVGATLIGPGHARHTAEGKTFIGATSVAMRPRAADLAAAFTAAGLPTEATDQLWSMVWGKLVINAALNAVAALLGVGGDVILRSDSARELTGLVARETAAVAQALGIQLPFADPAERVWQHCRDIGTARPSMFQDVERGRPTEIDAINGAVMREGARLGVPTPFNHALVLLVKGLEDRAR